MATDSELLAEVRTVLRAEVAHLTADPALLATVRRRHARRRSVRRFLLLTTPVVAAAVVVVAVVPRSELPRGEGPEDTRPVNEVPVNVAHVLDRTSQALATVGGHVVYERGEPPEGEKYFQPGERGLSERWHAADGSAFRYRASVDGAPVVDLSRDAGADIFVDYRDKTYRKRPGVPDGGAGDATDDVWTPDEIRQAITDGRITVAGPAEPINGKPTVKLIVSEVKASVGSDLWVDATTYLPVRWQWHQKGATTFDVTWLPPTPENIAQLQVPIPPEFTEVR